MGGLSVGKCILAQGDLTLVRHIYSNHQVSTLMVEIESLTVSLSKACLFWDEELVSHVAKLIAVVHLARVSLAVPRRVTDLAFRGHSDGKL